MASSARKNLCAALKIDCFAPKPVPEKEEAPDLEAGGDEELDYKQETTTPVAEPRPPASLRRSPSDEPYLEPRDDDDAPNALVKVARSSTALPAVWKSKFYGSFVLNRRVVLHAIDATPARWRGGAGSSPLDGAGTATSVHPTHWLISTQVTGVRFVSLFSDDRHGRLDDDGHGVARRARLLRRVERPLDVGGRRRRDAAAARVDGGAAAAAGLGARGLRAGRAPDGVLLRAGAGGGLRRRGTM